MDDYLKMGKVITLAAFLGVTSCKHAEEAGELSDAKSAPATKSQCGNLAAFGGVCTVAEVTGRLGTSTDAARKAQVGSIQKIIFEIPITGDTKQATVKFATNKAPLDSWTVDQALDLYSRKGCLAQISGGIFAEGYAPVLTIKSLLNVQDDGQTGFAEVSDHATSPPTYASLRLNCEWQR